MIPRFIMYQDDKKLPLFCFHGSLYYVLLFSPLSCPHFVNCVHLFLACFSPYLLYFLCSCVCWTVFCHRHVLHVFVQCSLCCKCFVLFACHCSSCILILPKSYLVHSSLVHTCPALSFVFLLPSCQLTFLVSTLFASSPYWLPYCSPVWINSWSLTFYLALTLPLCLALPCISKGGCEEFCF